MLLRSRDVGRAQRVLVAVSGGADSVALLHLLAALGQRIAVGHVHHGLRPGAERDLVFVADLSHRLGVPCRTRRVDARARDGRSPEARARSMRYAALEELRRELDCAYTATAHTLDDQAETVLLRAVRGTGLAGLSGIAPGSEAGRLLRPLLAIPRAELRAYLEARSLVWREDPTNRDLSIPRNRMRASVLPVLEQIHPGAARKLAQLAELARESRDGEGAQIEAALARASSNEAGGIWLDPMPLAGLSPAGRQRALVVFLARAGLGGRVTRAHVRRLERFLDEAPRGAALSLPGAHALVRRAERFWLGPAGEAPGAGAGKARRRRDLRILLPRSDASSGRDRRDGDR